MGAIAEAAAGLVGGIFDAGKTIYDIWSNQRDFDYQKNLQQEIFTREDNAVQRRMEDLKKAGLNPNLAAGSAAGAGAVVGRSNTPGISGNPVGSALDMAQHVQQLRAQRTENEILKNQKDKSAADAKVAENDAMLSELEFLNYMGIKPTLSYNPNKKTFSIAGNIDFGNGFSPVTRLGGGDSTLDKDLTEANSRLMQYFNWQYQNNKNSADMLQKDNNFYVADKIGQYLGQGVQLFQGAGSGYFNFTRRR